MRSAVADTTTAARPSRLPALFLGVVAAAYALGSCVAGGGDGSAPAPDPAHPPAEGAPDPAPTEVSIPGIPEVDGPLELRVSYPRAGTAISTRDENFIFGSAGDGDARVWINGTEVEVRANGAFLAFLPVPPDGVYRLRAVLDGQEEEIQVEVPIPPAPPSGTAVIDRASISPSGGWVALPGERIEAGFRGTPGGSAALVFADGNRVPLLEGVAHVRGLEAWLTGRAGGGG